MSGALTELCDPKDRHAVKSHDEDIWSSVDEQHQESAKVEIILSTHLPSLNIDLGMYFQH